MCQIVLYIFEEGKPADELFEFTLVQSWLVVSSMIFRTVGNTDKCAFFFFFLFLFIQFISVILYIFP